MGSFLLVTEASLSDHEKKKIKKFYDWSVDILTFFSTPSLTDPE